MNFQDPSMHGSEVTGVAKKKSVTQRTYMNVLYTYVRKGSVPYKLFQNIKSQTNVI